MGRSRGITGCGLGAGGKMHFFGGGRGPLGTLAGSARGFVFATQRGERGAVANILPARLARRPGPRSKRRRRRLRVPIGPGAAVFAAVGAPTESAIQAAVAPLARANCAGDRDLRCGRRPGRFRDPSGGGAACACPLELVPQSPLRPARRPGPRSLPPRSHRKWAAGRYPRCCRRSGWARSKRRRSPLAAWFRRRCRARFCRTLCSPETAPAPGCFLR